MRIVVCIKQVPDTTDVRIDPERGTLIREGVESILNPLDAYAAADIYAQPTYYDPCSLTVLEALACGLPVITTRRNGASELLTHGRDGFILDRPGDLDGLAEAILALCEADLRRDVGAAARALAEGHSTERNYRGILAVYERAADGKRG